MRDTEHDEIAESYDASDLVDLLGLSVGDILEAFPRQVAECPEIQYILESLFWA